MMTAIYLIISGVLIGAGSSIIWRDVQKKRRGAFVSKRDVRTQTMPDVEITIEHGDEPVPPRRGLAPPSEAAAVPLRVFEEPHPAPLGSAAPIDLPVTVVAAPMPSQQPVAAEKVQVPITGTAPTPLETEPDSNEQSQPRQGARLALERQWSALQPAIAVGAERTNARLAPIRLFIGASGEPSWSYKNKGYGAYRRLLLAGESLAWLRLELVADGQLRCSVKAHREERAGINAAADVPASALGGEGAVALFSQCLERAEAFAARKLKDSDQEASEQAWQTVDGVVSAALKATNGALAQAGARLVTVAPASWASELRRHRMALSVEVNGDDVARMHIERFPHEMEVAVGVREPQLAALARRRRIPIEGMTIHALAELIASCAWPAIARFRDIRRPA